MHIRKTLPLAPSYARRMATARSVMVCIRVQCEGE